MPEPVPTLPHLRAAIAKHRSKAALVPGLPDLLTLIESHLVETDQRLRRLEVVNMTPLANLEAARQTVAAASSAAIASALAAQDSTPCRCPLEFLPAHDAGCPHG